MSHMHEEHWLLLGLAECELTVSIAELNSGVHGKARQLHTALIGSSTIV